MGQGSLVACRINRIRKRVEGDCTIGNSGRRSETVELLSILVSYYIFFWVWIQIGTDREIKVLAMSSIFLCLVPVSINWYQISDLGAVGIADCGGIDGRKD